MTMTESEARIARLRASRDRLEAQLADPRTPPYSVAPLSNQLRLVDKELDLIHRRVEEENDGLPTTPDETTVVDFLQFGWRGRGGRAPHRQGNEWARRQAAIFDEWQAAGFVLPPRPERSEFEDRRDVLHDWADACRDELVRCLENQSRKESP